MAMSYTSLTAAKGTPYALATWVDYTKLDTFAIVDEAQTLLFSTLRTREMLSDLMFTMPLGGTYLPLPVPYWQSTTNFLEAIGRIMQTSINMPISHKDSNTVERNRTYNESNGTLGANPFTTTSGSNTVSVALPNHGFAQDSIFYTAGATAFNGVTIAGTFRVTGITDANDFTIDITALGTTPSASGSGGGSAVTYTCDSMIQGMPIIFGIWNETIYFDMAFSQLTICKMQYYASPQLLSASNQTNFLTNRYPQLLRIACMASAANYMKDNEEYQKLSGLLMGMVQQVNAENDMSWRGMELLTDTP